MVRDNSLCGQFDLVIFSFILVSVLKHEQATYGFYALTLLSIKSVLWSTIPQVAMPIKCSCDS